MTLIDENEVILEQEKKKKMFKLLTKVIVILLLVCIILLIFSNIIKNNTFKCYIDDNKVNTIKSDVLLKDNHGQVCEENGTVFLSIRKLSGALGYQFYNSEYKKKGEDKSKCQIKTNNIYTSYIGGSNAVYKAIEPEIDNSKDKKKNQTSSSTDPNAAVEEEKKVEFEYFKIKENVRYVNDDLYASIEAIELGFDIIVEYNKKDNSLKIKSANKLEEVAGYARKDVVKSDEYSYKNKRLLKYGMTIVKDAEGNYGVASYTNSEKMGSFVASCKYQSIDFNEGTRTFSVVSKKDNQKSILHINLENQQVDGDMNTQYDDIKAMTDEFKQFVVKQNEKYGVVGTDGETIIPIEFEEIGVKEEKFTDVTCSYMIKEQYVPVKLNGLWGLYNIAGTEIIVPQFQDLGCSIAQSGDSVLYVTNIKGNTTGIVFMYDKDKPLYGVYNADNGEKIAVSVTEVYKRQEDGDTNYYINHIVDGSSSKVHIFNLRTEV